MAEDTVVYDVGQYELGDIPPLHAVEGEWEIAITNVKEGIDKNGNPYLMPYFEVVDDPDAKEFNQFIGLPGTGDSVKARNSKLRKFTAFLEAFGLDTDGSVNFIEAEGSTATALLRIQEDAQYGDKSAIVRFV